MTAGSTVQKSFVTTQEAARMLGMSLRTVQLWAESGLLSCWKTEGGHRRIPLESVERLLADRAGRDRVSGDERSSRQFAPAAARPLSVLVVEDEPTLLRLYRLQLARWALRPEVTTAVNGYEALVRIGRLRPDLLIADLHMSEMDGFDMLRTLRAMPELDAMEIVVVTGLDADEVARRGGLPGGIPVLPKPIPFDQLEAIAGRISAELGRQPARTSGG